MSSTKKTIIGILTVLPIVFLVLYFVSIFSFVMNIEQTGTTDPGEMMGRMASAFIYIGIMIVLSIAMLVYYIIDITKNPKFQDGGNNKLMWILIVIFAGMIGMIVYFFVEIYPRRELPPIPNKGEIV